MHKLPALLAIKHALMAVIHFRYAGIRIGLPWILVLAGVSFLDRNFFTSADFTSYDATSAMVYRPTELIIAALSIVVFSSIAVNWHRYILLDEVTASEKIFRLDRPVWNYAGRTLLIMLIALVPALALSAIVLNALPNFRLLLAFPFFVAGIYVMRMSVALPALALARKDFGITQALQVTQGNNWQFADVARGSERGQRAARYIGSLVLHQLQKFWIGRLANRREPMNLFDAFAAVGPRQFLRFVLDLLAQPGRRLQPRAGRSFPRLDSIGGRHATRGESEKGDDQNESRASGFESHAWLLQPTEGC